MARLYKILGYAGAIPFVICAAGLFLIEEHAITSLLALIQLSYAGLIASFLSGVHWAHALPRENTLQALLAMLPTIISLGLFVVAIVMGILAWPLFIASVGFKLIFVMDKKFLEPDWLPADYFKFRMVITLVACTSLFISALSFWI